MIYAEFISAAAATAAVGGAVGGGILWLMRAALAPLKECVDRLVAAERRLTAALEGNRRETERLARHLAALEERVGAQAGRIERMERSERREPPCLLTTST